MQPPEPSIANFGDSSATVLSRLPSSASHFLYRVGPILSCAECGTTLETDKFYSAHAPAVPRRASSLVSWQMALSDLEHIDRHPPWSQKWVRHAPAPPHQLSRPRPPCACGWTPWPRTMAGMHVEPWKPPTRCPRLAQPTARVRTAGPILAAQRGTLPKGLLPVRPGTGHPPPSLSSSLCKQQTRRRMRLPLSLPTDQMMVLPGQI